MKLKCNFTCDNYHENQGWISISLKIYCPSLGCGNTNSTYVNMGETSTVIVTMVLDLL